MERAAEATHLDVLAELNRHRWRYRLRGPASRGGNAEAINFPKARARGRRGHERLV
jgi:hypothetical protein